mmetsp:Transcript_131221/g.331348  ORF Transcript_131221/g.331348 Transcript_131221/m.331348 type:complete len:257 (-) Transcript_131221:363-1133(-)
MPFSLPCKPMTTASTHVQPAVLLNTRTWSPTRMGSCAPSAPVAATGTAAAAAMAPEALSASKLVADRPDGAGTTAAQSMSHTSSTSPAIDVDNLKAAGHAWPSASPAQTPPNVSSVSVNGTGGGATGGRRGVAGVAGHGNCCSSSAGPLRRLRPLPAAEDLLLRGAPASVTGARRCLRRSLFAASVSNLCSRRRNSSARCSKICSSRRRLCAQAASLASSSACRCASALHRRPISSRSGCTAKTGLGVWAALPWCC